MALTRFLASSRSRKDLPAAGPLQPARRIPAQAPCPQGAQPRPYSTVTDFARLRGLSTSHPRASAT